MSDTDAADELTEALLESERELAQGDAETYRRRLVEEALLIVPGMVLDREAAAEAMEASPGWDQLELRDPRLLPLGEGALLISYRFRGRRGPDFVYEADMSSAYVERDGIWLLAFHQQTPRGS